LQEEPVVEGFTSAHAPGVVGNGFVGVSPATRLKQLAHIAWYIIPLASNLLVPPST
jgi:hypothetical protein